MQLLISIVTVCFCTEWNLDHRWINRLNEINCLCQWYLPFAYNVAVPVSIFSFDELFSSMNWMIITSGNSLMLLNANIGINVDVLSVGHLVILYTVAYIYRTHTKSPMWLQMSHHLTVLDHQQVQRWLQSYTCFLLTHLPRNKMAAISQTIFSHGFLWMKSFVFRLKFHWSLFLRVQLTITQHWFR